MGTAIFTAVTGLQAHQRRLDVIANNIANVNTPGFRGARMLFQDLFAQTLEGARAGDETHGGSNPMQVGLGAQLASIDVNHAQGSLFTTGVNSDLAIQGNGFFVLSRGAGQGYYYTRDGSFTLNAQGELIDPATGMRVQGYLANENGVIDVNTPVTNLVVPLGGVSIVRATTLATLIGNLDSRAAVGDTVQRSLRVYDSLGNVRDVAITFTKSANPNEWDWQGSMTDPEVSAVTASGTLTFDGDGRFVSSTSDTVSIDFVDTIPALPTDPLDFRIDFTTLTMLAADSDVTLQTQDGYPRGVLASFNVGRDGVINGVFTNGLARVVGQVALAAFSNVGGLSKEGANLFRETPVSGVAQIGAPNTGGRGQVSGGVLEGSNVDLGTEFSNLILTQRGFQANARTITIADTLLQEAVNLVR